jgi:hypothetical protein
MSDGLVRLIWEVDPRGYEIVKHDALRGRDYPALSAAVHGPLSSRRAQLRLAIMWDRLEVRDDVEFIVPRGGKPTRYEAALLEHEIFLDLANSARRPGPDGVLEFVNKWGQLTGPLIRPLEGFLRERDALVRALGHADKDIAHLLNEVSKRESPAFLEIPHRELGILHARSVHKGRSSRVFLQSETLLQFCTLELLRAHDSDIDIKACGACGKFLPLPRKGRPKKFCDDTCKMKSYRFRHRDKLNRARRRERAKRRRGA